MRDGSGIETHKRRSPFSRTAGRSIRLLTAMVVLPLLNMSPTGAAGNNLLPLQRGMKIVQRIPADVIPGGGIEAVVLLNFECPNSSECGNASYQELVVTRGRLLKRVAKIETSLPAILRFKVKGRKITVTGLQHSADDANCCPSVGFYEVWQFRAGRFEAIEGGDFA